MKYGPSDLVALADLVHAPGEDAEGGEEDGNGAGALVRDPTGESDRGEPARWRPVLQKGHVLHAGHPRLVPYRCLRHGEFLSSIACSLLSLCTLPSQWSLYTHTHAHRERRERVQGWLRCGSLGCE